MKNRYRNLASLHRRHIAKLVVGGRLEAANIHAGQDNDSIEFMLFCRRWVYNC